MNDDPAFADKIEALWRRGAPGDLHEIERMRRENPRAADPPCLAFPHGLRASATLGPDDLEEAMTLLIDQYWTRDMPRDVLAGSHLHATAWVGARDGAGKLVATARAVSDVVRTAWIHDVIVAPVWRGRGVGTRVMSLLLDHPAVRRAAVVKLFTKDAQAVYQKLGFVETTTLPVAFPKTEMTLLRKA